MANNQIDILIAKMLEWEEIAEQAKKEADAIKDSLKEEMKVRGVDEINTGRFIIKWSTIVRNVFDSSAFKKVHSDLYKAFLRQSESKRWTVSQ